MWVQKKMDVELNSIENNNNNNNRFKRIIDISADHTSNNDLDGGNNDDYPDVDFEYNDADTHFNEIAELYSYTEQNEFQLNVKAFEDIMDQYNMIPCWQKLTLAQRKVIVLKLLEQLDVSNKVIRMRAARCILYLAQGCFIEVQSDIEQQDWTRINVMLLYELGTWNAFIDLLNIEIENSNSTNIVMRKVAVSLADSVDLRIILSVLYIITEVMRVESDEYSEYKCYVDSFKQEINQPYGDELLAVKLLGMVTKFCSAAAPHFPMKKVLLLLWKISLVGLGGMDTLKKLKNEYRQQFNLPPSTEDVFEITKTMRVTSPTPDFTDNLKRDRPLRRVRTNDIAQEGLIKQSSLDEQEQIDMDLPSLVNEEDISDYYRPCDDSSNEGNNNNNNSSNGSETGSESGCFSNSPNSPTYSPLGGLRFQSRLPWTPKVRQKDIDQFLQISRKKFLGYILYNDNTSLAGLPPPIHEGYKTLKKNEYVSLADIQIKKEEVITRNPITNNDDDLKMTPTEILYQSILPNLPQYMISLLKILLAGLPTSKTKTEGINIMADVLPEEMPMTVTQTTKLGIDVNRHKEIIIKAVSAILLLYLKHFKINHIYQFEFMSQHLVFANCIPLVLKFLNQNILEYVASKNVIPIIDFPSCIIGEQPELTSDSLVIGDSAPYSWRNIFSTINLLRILNKLTKWKHSRIMMLVVFKSAPILKRTIHVRHAMMQLFVLKLLKMQTKYLGRQWRKTNMKIISAIYWKVRHRLNDDWAFAHDVDARPWDFQTEECLLRTCVDRFNNRRYLSGNLMTANRMATTMAAASGTSYNNNNNVIGGNNNNNNNNNSNLCSQNLNDLNDFEQNGMIDMNMNNILNGDRYNYIQGYGGWDEHVELSDEFKQNYEDWLEQEVFNNCIDWDQLFQKN